MSKIVLKNLEAHRKRNTKTALMLMIAVQFLILCGSGFAQFEALVTALSKAIINGDISLFIATSAIAQYPISIDEAAIR
jgi:hypothetical protein